MLNLRNQLATPNRDLSHKSVTTTQNNINIINIKSAAFGIRKMAKDGARGVFEVRAQVRPEELGRHLVVLLVGSVRINCHR